MKTLFAPGCALRKYKPGLIDRMAAFLLERGLADGVYTTCCKEDERFEGEITLITCCPGCSHHFQGSNPEARIVSLWQVLLDTDYPFPDYHGEKMSIHDACPARHRDSSEMQVSSRELCRKMNISLVEPACTREETPCCGGSAPDLATRVEMARRRAAAFSEKNVVVYCTGCTRSFSVTEVSPRHLLDLLFRETTKGLYPPGYVQV